LYEYDDILVDCLGFLLKLQYVTLVRVLMGVFHDFVSVLNVNDWSQSENVNRGWQTGHVQT